MPALLLGGIYSGAFTPTEAAAVSAFYALLLAMIGYRTLGLRELFEVVAATARTTAIVTIILGGAFIFNYVVTVEQLPQEIFQLFSSLDLSPAQFLLVVNVLYLILGCFLEVSTIMLVITPLFIPTAAALGINLVHFGVVVVFNMMIGLITPPYGVLLFIIKALNGVPLGEMIREIWPFIIVLIAILLLITYVPALVLWLPGLASVG
jgi:tripartite ATP-independent transporter DctM subunit